MEKAKENCEEEWRQKEMGRVLGNIFHSFNPNDGPSQSLAVAVENDLMGWNRDFVETISLSDLAEFMLQVAGRIFAKGQTVDRLLWRKWESENSDKTHWDEFVGRLEAVGECNHTFDGSKKILKDMGYSESEIDEIIEWFEFKSAYCDSEVHLNIVMTEEF